MSQVERAYYCPINETLRFITGKWKPSILCELRDGPRRFSDIKRALIGVSEKVLSAQLKGLEADSIISRREFRDGGLLRTEYSFTTFGATLKPALDALARWGMEYRNSQKSLST